MPLCLTLVRVLLPCPISMTEAGLSVPWGSDICPHFPLGRRLEFPFPGALGRGGWFLKA